MPRINRRRPHYKVRGLSEAQRELLIFGTVMLAAQEQGFDDENAMLRAWREQRSELMAQVKPGRRPHAYFKFELGCEPRCWYEEVKALLEAGLITPEEAHAIEHQYPLLNGRQTPECYSAFDEPESVRTQGLGRYVLEQCVGEFDLAKFWHRWRGRQQIAERYKVRADSVRKILRAET